MVALIGLILGAVLGALVAQRSIQQRQHALAVMWLSQFHLQELVVAVQGGNCAAAEASVSHLHALADELALALPLADAQDSTFHGYLQEFRNASAPAAGQCGDETKRLQRVREACAACHRDYR